MGAQLSTVAPTATVPIDAYISELGDLTYSGDLGRSRFLKTVKAVHRDGVVAVKVFIKPTTTQLDIGPVKEKVKDISNNLRRDLGPLNGFPNAIGYSRIVETDRAGYLVRQYIKHSLYDRISTRPFLEPIEKKWIAFQILKALKSCHEHNIFHGDIKSENILVGSWKWIYLADFAPFKPVTIPETDSAQFLFYFDVSQRRACYVAPERFSQGTITALNAAMDVYSAGCVIAELFLDGQPLFSLADLFKYKRGEYTPDLSSIGDESVQELIESMVNVDPNARLSASEYLEKFKNKVFPDYFESYWHLLTPFSGSAGSTSSDDMLIHLWKNFESEILDRLVSPDDATNSAGGIEVSTSSLPVIVTLPHRWVVPTKRASQSYDNGALIILSFVCSALISTSSVEWRLRAAKLILVLAEYVSDDAKLDRCLPYLVYLLRDPQVIVRNNALIYITHLMSMVTRYSTLNEKVYSAYLFPRISQAVNNNSPTSLRSVYAECLPNLAQYSVECEGWEPVIDFIEEATQFLLVDKVPLVRRSLLEHADTLCTVLQKQGTNDIILSHTITYLNDKDPFVRMDLFRFIAKAAPLMGPVSIEQYVVPLLIQSLCEPREDIVSLVLQSLVAIVDVGLLRLKTLLTVVVPSCLKFLIHPNTYIRTQALFLVAASAAKLSKAQAYCLLRPLLSSYLNSDVSDYSDYKSLVEALRSPISQAVYVMAMQWALKAKNSAFWQANVPSNTMVQFSQEDRRWLARLREVGFNNEDLWQLLAFRDYIWQLSLMMSSQFNSKDSPEIDTAEAELAVEETDSTTPSGGLSKTWKSRRGLASWSGGAVPEGLEDYIQARVSSEKRKVGPRHLYIGPTRIPADSRMLISAANSNAEADGSNDAVSAIKGSKVNGHGQAKPVPTVLVTSIKAHRGAIKVLTAHPNNRVFVTAADDGVVRLWDVKSILKGSSRPSIVWEAEDPITAGAFLLDTSILIVGTVHGKTSFLDCRARYNEAGSLAFDGLNSIIDFSLDEGFPIAYHVHDGDLWLLQSSGYIRRIDFSTLETKQTLCCPKEQGPPTCWAWSRTGDWIIVGTLHGMLELFDTRFGLLVNSWGIGELEAITALELHPNKEECVCVGGGFRRNLISVWDIKKVECVELLVPLPDLEDDSDELPSTAPIPSTLQSLPERFASWSLSDTFSRPQPPVTTLSGSLNGGTHLLSGGGDKILRCWDLYTPHLSGIISGTSHTQVKLNYMGKVGSSIKYTYEVSAPLKSPGKLSRGTLIGYEEQDIGRNHKGTISKVILLEPANDREIAVSVDEVGVIKVFA